MSPLEKAPAIKQVPATWSPRDEEARIRLTAQFDDHLAGYKTISAPTGEVLKELKAIYCRPGCRGNWKSFLLSRGLAVSTADGLIREYVEEQRRIEREHGEEQYVEERCIEDDPRQPSGENPPRSKIFVQMKLSLGATRKSQFQAAAAKLGRAKATRVMFAAAIHAAAEAKAAQLAEHLAESAPRHAHAQPQPTPESPESATFPPEPRSGDPNDNNVAEYSDVAESRRHPKNLLSKIDPFRQKDRARKEPQAHSAGFPKDENNNGETGAGFRAIGFVGRWLDLSQKVPGLGRLIARRAVTSNQKHPEIDESHR